MWNRLVVWLHESSVGVHVVDFKRGFTDVYNAKTARALFGSPRAMLTSVVVWVYLFAVVNAAMVAVYLALLPLATVVYVPLALIPYGTTVAEWFMARVAGIVACAVVFFVGEFVAEAVVSGRLEKALPLDPQTRARHAICTLCNTTLMFSVGLPLSLLAPASVAMAVGVSAFALQNQIRTMMTKMDYVERYIGYIVGFSVPVTTVAIVLLPTLLTMPTLAWGAVMLRLHANHADLYTRDDAQPTPIIWFARWTWRRICQLLLAAIQRSGGV